MNLDDKHGWPEGTSLRRHEALFFLAQHAVRKDVEL